MSGQVDLLTRTLLDTDGTLLFSTNRRGFKPGTETLMQAVPGLQIEDITRATLPRDVQRKPVLRYCWIIIG